MSEMKYLMLFEAFEASALSKMMIFLKDKTDNNSKNMFRDRLKSLTTQLDIPIDKIKDKDIKYLNRNQALKLKSDDDDVSLYCLKFWFSLDDGYLGFTGTGNKTMDFNDYIQGRRRSEEKNEPFSNRQLDYIKDDLGIKTGTLEPVKNYEKIEHGQLVIGIFSDDDDSLDRLGLAKIWKENDHLYAIQNVADGGSPESDVDGQNWIDYRQENPIFRSSWSLDNVHHPGSDHCKLHIYEPSDEPLKLIGAKEEETDNPLNFNLPVNRYYNLKEWGDTDFSIDDYKKIDKSDFSIVLMIDDIIKSVETKVGDVRKSRKESKEGATSLMSDSEIKKENVKRYLQILVSNMGIKTDTSNLQNLQRLVLKSICGDFAFISIYKSRPGFDSLDAIINSIYNIMNTDSDIDKKSYLERATENYEVLNKRSDEYKKKYSKSLEVIKKSNNPKLNELIDIIIKIGQKINKYLLSQNIQSIEDLRMVVVKLQSIRVLSEQNEFKFEGSAKRILNNFYDDGDVEYYCRPDNYTENEIDINISRAKQLERYVDSLLK